MSPAVSIVVPTHNRGELLMQTLESVKTQTFQDFECIVVDDHSTDDTVERITPLLAEDSRFSLAPSPRRGAQAARNTGIEIARGRYVILLDSDDLLADFCLQQRVPTMDANPAMDFAVFPCECFKKIPGDTRLLWNIATDTPDLNRFLSLDVPWQTTSPIWRRESITRLLPWPEDVPVAQDWEFHIRALLANMRYARFGRPDHYWRQAETGRDSIGKNTMRPQMLAARVAVNERVYREVQNAGRLTDDYRTAFAGLFFQSAERVAAKVSRRSGCDIWGRARRLGLIGDVQLRQGNIYLRLGRFKPLQAAYRRRLKRHWPAAFFAPRSATYLKSPVVLETRGDGNTTPAVSVVMSAYNAQRYLTEAMQSILEQTLADWEMIVVDDGSTDATPTILRQFAQRDARIKVISRENKGLTVSLNEALAAAAAPLIARMDADDIALPQRLANQVAFLNANPAVAVVSSSVELIDPFGVHIGVMNQPTDHAAIDAELMKGSGGAIVHPAAMFRTEIVRKIGGYRAQYNNSEDLDLWLRLSEVGQMANLPEVLLKYRRDLGSVSHTKRENQLRMKSHIVGEAYARRGLTPPNVWRFDAWMPKAHDVQLKEWGWKALAVGRRDAAIGHAKSLLKLHPLSADSWRLMLCAWRGR